MDGRHPLCPLYTSQSIAVPNGIEKAFSSYSQDPIQINAISAPLLLNILWAIGISNKTTFNEQSPLQGKKLPNFASTSGWTLRKEKMAELLTLIK